MGRRRSRRLERLGHWFTLALVVAALGAAAFVHLRWVYRERRVNPVVEETAARLGADKFLIKAVIRRESKFDPFAYGRAGEIGLMQVTAGAGEDWARATGRRDFRKELLWDMRTNVEAGTWYLSRAWRRWQAMDDPLPFALAEYNAGLGRVQQWRQGGTVTNAAAFVDNITIPSVREYIRTVREYYAEYRERGHL
jgi:soluble lytic murein transglycosylase